MGRKAEAQARLEESIVLFQELGDRRIANQARSEVAHLQRRQGNCQQALMLYRETIASWLELGHRAAVAHQLECLAFIAQAQGQPERAARLLGAAEALRHEAASAMTPSERDEYDQAVLDLRSQLDEASLTIAWTAGRAMTTEQAVAYALDEPGSHHDQEPVRGLA